MRATKRLRRTIRRHWPTIAVTVILSALLVNVWVHDGGGVVLLLGGITVGCMTVVFACAVTSGHLVVKHADKTQRAIEAHEQRKELTR